MARKYVNPNRSAAGPRGAYPMAARFRNEAGTTRVDIFDDVGSDGWGGGLTAKSFSEQLAAVKGPLSVHVNSGGGDLFDGLGIYNALKEYPGRVTAVVDGIAASIASVIIQAADERVINRGGMVMVHDAWKLSGGNAAELRREADLLDKVSNNLASVYADRCGGTAQHWRDVMRQEAWFDAGEAVQARLADRVAGPAAVAPAGLDLDAYSPPGRIAAALRSMPQAAAPSGDSPDDGSCKTCGGWGRLKHPGTGKAGVKCPGCAGTGTYSPDEGGTQARRMDPETAREAIRQLRSILPPLTTSTTKEKR